MYYYFDNALKCLVTVSKHKQAMSVEGEAERFIAFECFDTVVKHAEQVVEIAAQMNAVNSCSVLINNHYVVTNSHLLCLVELA